MENKSESYIPLASRARDGWSKEDEATATCFCGAVQLAFVSLMICRRGFVGASSRLPYHRVDHSLIPCCSQLKGQV